MSDYDAWKTNAPEPVGQSHYEDWYVDNEDQLEGLNQHEIESIYEDFLNDELDDHDIYRDVEEYEDY